jgi:hypothetical protein
MDEKDALKDRLDAWQRWVAHLHGMSADKLDGKTDDELRAMAEKQLKRMGRAVAVDAG